MTTDTCPLCGAAGRPAFTTTDRNRGVEDRTFSYLRCIACATLFLHDVPDDLARFYPPDYFSLPTLAQLREQAAGERYRLEAVLPHATAGRLTEIGPGNGIFAVQAKDAGFDTAVVEMDAGAADYLRDVVGVEAVRSDTPEDVLPQMPPSRVIAMWHVLEHLPHPMAALRAAADNLQDGGILLIAVPNPSSFGMKVLRGRWPHVDAPRHLTLIPSEALAGCLAGLGLTPVVVDTDDPGARHWNRFSWRALIGPTRAGRWRRLFGLAAGTGVAAVTARAERRPGLGSTYTAVFRKGA
jgi:SAM-dependent methyltransferase